MLPLHRTKSDVFNYEEIPEGYYFNVMVSGKAPQRFWHQKKFRSVLHSIPRGARVLDVGCGPGSLLHLLAESLPEFHGTGVDIASSQLNFAQSNVKARNPGQKIDFVPLEKTKVQLPFASQTFDFVTCVEVVEHLHPYLAHLLLLEIRRVLKPSGRLRMTTPNYRSLWPLIEYAIEKTSPVKYHEQHISKFTPNSFLKFVESGGFQIESFSTLFVLSPFLTSISWKLGEAAFALEKKFLPRLGNLLLLEASLWSPSGGE